MPEIKPEHKKLLGEGWIRITCKCGHVDSMDNFSKTPINGDLPLNTYQCPKCHFAFRKVPEGRFIEIGGGRMIREAMTIEQIPMQA